MTAKAIGPLLAVLLAAAPMTHVVAQTTEPPPTPGVMMLTVFLKHDQSKTLAEINADLKRQHFPESFPPKGVEVVSWVVMMGIGQVVTLRFPAERLREVNRSLEETAWGAYRTEFYPTYDYKPTAMRERESAP